jgi:hypothetical protein
MKMRQRQGVDRLAQDAAAGCDVAGFNESIERAAAAIHHDQLVANFDDLAGAAPQYVRSRYTGPEQGDFHAAIFQNGMLPGC